MINLLAIVRKEIYSYWVSPVAYVVIALLLAALGFFFSIRLVQTGEATMRYAFQDSQFFLLLVTPLVTMRLLAEEKRQGTIELLLTSPVRDWEVVAGKFLSGLFLIAVALLGTLVYLGVLVRYGAPKVQVGFLPLADLEWGPILTGYLGEVLLAGAFVAVGLLASSITQNQIVAGVVALIALIMLWVAGAVSTVVGPPVADFLGYLSTTSHLDSFARGALNSVDIAYYLSLIVLGLFLSTQALSGRRWR